MSKILVINTGSTSVKWRIVQVGEVLGEGSYTHEKTDGVNFNFWQNGEQSTGFLGEVKMIPRHLLGVASRLGTAITVVLPVKNLHFKCC